MDDFYTAKVIILVLITKKNGMKVVASVHKNIH